MFIGSFRPGRTAAFAQALVMAVDTWLDGLSVFRGFETLQYFSLISLRGGEFENGQENFNISEEVMSR